MVTQIKFALRGAHNTVIYQFWQVFGVKLGIKFEKYCKNKVLLYKKGLLMTCLFFLYKRLIILYGYVINLTTERLDL